MKTKITLVMACFIGFVLSSAAVAYEFVVISIKRLTEEKVRAVKPFEPGK